MKFLSQFLFWWRCLVVVTSCVLLFGATMFVAPGFTRRSFGLLLFSSSERLSALGEPATAYITLVHGVLGSVMFGWGTGLLLVLLGPLRRGGKEGWRTFVISLLAWFVPDTLFSLWLGFWQNATLNAVLVVLFAVPLTAMHRALDHTDRS